MSDEPNDLPPDERTERRPEHEARPSTSEDVGTDGPLWGGSGPRKRKRKRMSTALKVVLAIAVVAVATPFLALLALYIACMNSGPVW